MSESQSYGAASQPLPAAGEPAAATCKCMQISYETLVPCHRCPLPAYVEQSTVASCQHPSRCSNSCCPAGYELLVAGGLEPSTTAQWPWDDFISQHNPQRSPRSALRGARPTSSCDAAGRTTIRRGGRAVAGAAPRARPVPTGRASRAGAVKAEPKEEPEEVPLGAAVKQEAAAPAAAATAAKPRRRRPVLTGARRAAPAAEQVAKQPAGVKDELLPAEAEQEQRQQHEPHKAASAPAPAVAVAPAAAPVAAPVPAATAPTAAAPPVRADPLLALRLSRMIGLHANCTRSQHLTSAAVFGAPRLQGGLMFNALFGDLGVVPPAAAAPAPTLPPPAPAAAPPAAAAQVPAAPAAPAGEAPAAEAPAAEAPAKPRMSLRERMAQLKQAQQE